MTLLLPSTLRRLACLVHALERTILYLYVLVFSCVFLPRAANTGEAVRRALDFSFLGATRALLDGPGLGLRVEVHDSAQRNVLPASAGSRHTPNLSTNIIRTKICRLKHSGRSPCGHESPTP